MLPGICSWPFGPFIHCIVVSLINHNVCSNFSLNFSFLIFLVPFLDIGAITFFFFVSFFSVQLNLFLTISVYLSQMVDNTISLQSCTTRLNLSNICLHGVLPNWSFCHFSENRSAFLLSVDFRAGSFPLLWLSPSSFPSQLCTLSYSSSSLSQCTHSFLCQKV